MRTQSDTVQSTKQDQDHYINVYKWLSRSILFQLLKNAHVCIFIFIYSFLTSVSRFYGGSITKPNQAQYSLSRYGDWTKSAGETIFSITPEGGDWTEPTNGTIFTTSLECGDRTRSATLIVLHRNVVTKLNLLMGQYLPTHLKVVTRSNLPMRQYSIMLEWAKSAEGTLVSITLVASWKCMSLMSITEYGDMNSS